MNLIAKSGRLGRGLLLIVIGLVALAIAGCGGNGEEAPTTAAQTPTTEADSDLIEGAVLTLSWARLSDDIFSNTIALVIITRLQAVADGFTIGPYEAFVRADGSARVGIDEAYDPSEEWTVSYYIDVDSNQMCEEGGADIVRQHALRLGADRATLDYTSDAAPGGLCEGALFGFSNLLPRSAQ